MRDGEIERENAQIRPNSKTNEMFAMLCGDCGEEEENFSSVLLFSA